MKKVKLAVLVSGRGSNLQAIIDNIEKGALSAELAVVISDQADAYALERARKHNVPAVHVSAKGYRGKRDDYDALLVKDSPHAQCAREDARDAGVRCRVLEHWTDFMA